MGDSLVELGVGQHDPPEHRHPVPEDFRLRRRSLAILENEQDGKHDDSRHAQPAVDILRHFPSRARELQLP
jgi:hypothetical protein